MILILDCTCQDFLLLRDEFVTPILKIIRQDGYETCVQPLKSDSMPDNLQAVILTGTAIKDHEFLKTGLPPWLISWSGPVLGICAGMQLITLSMGGKLVPGEKIGMTEIIVNGSDPIFSGRERFIVWELHQSQVHVPDTIQVIARSAAGVQVIKRSDRPWYGVLFHPEVRNEWIIHNFLKEFVRK